MEKENKCEERLVSVAKGNLSLSFQQDINLLTLIWAPSDSSHTTTSFATYRPWPEEEGAGTPSRLMDHQG